MSHKMCQWLLLSGTNTGNLPSTVMPASNLSTWEGETGRAGVQGQFVKDKRGYMRPQPPHFQKQATATGTQY